jgi:hypothetical protein
MVRAGRKRGTKSRRYIWKISTLDYHLIDLCSDNLSEEAENDNDFDGDVYDNYTAKIF